MEHVLTRDAGPSGWAAIGDRQFAVDGWEIFEGDTANPNMCRGWFRCEDPLFAVTPGMEVRLRVTTGNGTARELTAEIVRKSTTGPIWEFRAE